MNYTTFKTKKNIEQKILRHLGILKITSRIIQINNYPDFDLSKYEGLSESTYYFRDSWSYEGHISAVTDISIESSAVFHYEDICRLSEEYGVLYKEKDGYGTFLDLIREKNIDVMSEAGISAEFDGFRLNSLQVERIDHPKKVVHFFGSYTGDSSTIEPLDWNLIIECAFSGFLSGEDSSDFYIDLVSESYALRDSGNLKLSYFILFTAFENFVNEKLGSQKEIGRLKEKLNLLFKTLYSSLERHQIYTSVAGQIDGWEKIRNEIAHGRSSNVVTRNEINGLSIFVLTLIASFETKTSKFEELLNMLEAV